jgi:hypothetical protein
VNGTANIVQIDREKDDHDHLITPEKRFRVAMAQLEHVRAIRGRLP